MELKGLKRMDYNGLLSNEIIKLPIIRKKDYFPDEIGYILIAYIDLLQVSNFPDNKIENVKKFQKSMERTIAHYYDGKPALMSALYPLLHPMTNVL